MKKFKNFAVSFITLIIVVALSIGITLAILSTTSNDKSNVFTGAGGIKLTAEEPAWDGATTPDPAVSGATAPPNGKTLAQNYYPGLEIPKDPALQNTSTDINAVDEYAAMRLDYQVKYLNKWYSISKAEFDNIAAVQYKKTDGSYADGFNTTDWDIAAAAGDIEADTFFYYKKDGGVLAKDAKTKTLFDRVVIKETLTGAPITTDTDFEFTTGRSYTDTTLDTSASTFTIKGFPQFRIVIKGVAVQSIEAGDYNTAKTNLDTLYPDKLAMLKVAE